MRFNNNKVEYCCNTMSRFLDICRTRKVEWEPSSDFDELVVIGFSGSAGYEEFGLFFCPFCGSKIEWLE